MPPLALMPEVASPKVTTALAKVLVLPGDQRADPEHLALWQIGHSTGNRAERRKSP
jgi:hypothetical protein